MKRKLSILTLLVFFCSTMFGQSSHWGDVPNYENTMTLYASIQINGEPITHDDYQVAAFCGDVLRGVEKPSIIPIPNSTAYYMVMSIGGVQSGEKIQLKIYDESTAVVYGTEYELTFSPNGRIGSLSDLEVINFIPMYWYPHDIHYYENSMTVMSVVTIEDEEANRADLEMAAFCGNELRGIARPIYNETQNCYLFPLFVSGNDNEIINLQLYDHSATDYAAFLPLHCRETLTFVKNGFLGEEGPVTFDFAPHIVKIGDKGYFTLAEAIEAAEAENTIILVGDVTAAGAEFNKNLTFDLNEKTYTLEDAEVLSVAAGNEVIFQNGNLANTDNNVLSISGVADFNSNFMVDGKVAINNGGQLYHNSDIQGTMTKSVVGTDTGWGTISSPVGKVEHDNVTGLLSATGTHDLYRYNETNSMYENVKDPSNVNFTTLEAGNGYLYANTVDTDVVFEGTFNTKAPKMSLSYTESSALAGFNLIGNPYTHNIDDSHFALSDVDAQLSNGFYVISEEGAWIAKAENATIAPMESVFVKTSKETELTINKDASSKSRSANNGMLAINVTNEQYSDVAYVSFNEGLGLDKISHRNSEIPMVYVPVKGVDYAIAMINRDVTEIPVSFKAMTMGEYTISAEGIDCEFSQLTLVDRMTGVETNLLLEDYSFMAKSGDNAERFIVRLQNSANANTTSENFVYVNNDELIINNIEGASVVRILDVLGRPVAEYNVYESANISTTSFRSGVYMVQMSGENGVKVQKIIID